MLFTELMNKYNDTSSVGLNIKDIGFEPLV